MFITEDIKYVGVNDHKVDLFEGQFFDLPEGMSKLEVADKGTLSLGKHELTFVFAQNSVTIRSAVKEDTVAAIEALAGELLKA